MDRHVARAPARETWIPRASVDPPASTFDSARDTLGLGRGDQQPVEAGVTDHAGVLHLDGDPAPHVDLHRGRGVGRIPVSVTSSAIARSGSMA